MAAFVAVGHDADWRRASWEHGHLARLRLRDLEGRSLRSASAGLSQAIARAGLAAGESVLIIADQFEELFRFDVTRAQQGDAAT